jgi:exosortase
MGYLKTSPPERYWTSRCSTQWLMPAHFRQRLQLLSLVGLASVFLLLYGQVLIDLSMTWLNVDGNNSHSLLVLPVVAFLIWNRRRDLAAAERRPAAFGLVIVVGSLMVLLIATAGVEFFLMRLSAIGVAAGIVLSLAGWPWLRLLLFPLGLTLLTIPLPPVLFYQVAFPLQLLATRLGVGALELMRIPVLREGNVIVLAHTTLEVTEACSGIRSLVSLFTLAVLYGYFTDPRPAPRVLIALSSIPIAIVANGLRITGTGIAAQYLGEAVATGFLHTFSGLTVFVTSFLMLVAVANALKMHSSPALGQPEPSVS